MLVNSRDIKSFLLYFLFKTSRVHVWHIYFMLYVCGVTVCILCMYLADKSLPFNCVHFIYSNNLNIIISVLVIKKKSLLSFCFIIYICVTGEGQFHLKINHTSKSNKYNKNQFQFHYTFVVNWTFWKHVITNLKIKLSQNHFVIT